MKYILILLFAFNGCNDEFESQNEKFDIAMDSCSYYMNKKSSDLSKEIIYFDSAVYYHGEATMAYKKMVEIYNK